MDDLDITTALILIAMCYTLYAYATITHQAVQRVLAAERALS